MKHAALLISLLILSGCTQTSADPSQEEEPQPELTIIEVAALPAIVYPMSDYLNRTTFKLFDQEVHDRFNGWHVADDLEVTEEELELDIPVYAIADGKVIYRNWLSGYGGLLVLQHQIDGQRIQSLYGHLDLNRTRPLLGDYVRTGTLISYLGADKSIQTDNERKHLHFALYPGMTLRLNGYEPSPVNVGNWINPTMYLQTHQAEETNTTLTYPDKWGSVNITELSDAYPFTLKIPEEWSLTFQPANESILFSNEDKVEVLLRYFDAGDFLTLSTVNVHERYLRSIQTHDAVDYLIEKKAWVDDFPNQPAWRNARHTVTDIRQFDGLSRFFVFAQNPDLDEKTIDYILNSITFSKQRLE